MPCKVMKIFLSRFLQGPDIPERQLYKEPPAAFLEADPLEVCVMLIALRKFSTFSFNDSTSPSLVELQTTHDSVGCAV